MKSQRHSHRHIDPRQPRSGTKPGTNPPVFAWRPPGGVASFDLVVARDPGFKGPVISLSGLKEPVFLPTRALNPGRYFWKWSCARGEGEVFEFEITASSVTLEVPSASDWLKSFSPGHPRIWISPGEVEELRSSRFGARAGAWSQLKEAADSLLNEKHEIEEPPFLGDWESDFEGVFASWYRIMNTSRKFMRDAMTLALAYVASGEVAYARAACRRVASISRWDPMGSSHISHNDEAHMSLLWDGPQIVDYVWEHFTDEERRVVVRQYRRRGEINFEHMHGRGSYGVTRFDSHAGREIVFLAMLAIVFHEEIPEAAAWLEWLRPVLCGIWPVLSGDDGSWSEGPSYGLAYVRIMSMFASALKKGTGVDLYSRPFWQGHANWRRWCFPPYAEWIGFGDQSERLAATWRGNAELVEIIARETGVHTFDSYAREFRAEAGKCLFSGEPRIPEAPSPQSYIAGPVGDGGQAESPGNMLQVFQDAGWAAVRTSVEAPEDDTAFIFRSSPYGAWSHSHSNNNDFIIHVGGKIMAMPSGYYDGYGSNHHAHWIWHTRSHNCLTLSGAGQLMRTRNSQGRIENAFEDDTGTQKDTGRRVDSLFPERFLRPDRQIRDTPRAGDVVV